MSIINEEYVKTMSELLEVTKQQEFDALYPLVEKLFKDKKQHKLLTKLYVLRALMYFRLNQIEELVKFIPQHVTFFQKHASEEDLLRFKNMRALALELNGYTEGFYEQMLEIKAYGERHGDLGLVVTAMINIGMLKGKNGLMQEALPYFQEAYAITQTLKDTNNERFNEHCICINNLLAVYIELGDFECARAYLHLEEMFQRCYFRFNVLYQTNVAKYYVETGQLEEAQQRLHMLRREIDSDEENAIYYLGVFECELALAKKLGDIMYETEAYKKLISVQKKSKQKRLLKTMMQSTYNSKRQEIIEVSQCDPLTQLYNRCGFVTKTEQLKRDNTEMSYITCGMIDIDYFKQINDEYGHLAGDQVIVQVAAVLKVYEAQGFVCARYGGDEFVITFLAHDEQYVTHRIKALYEQLRQTVFRYDDVIIPVTFTMGAVYVQRNETCSVDKLLQLADNVMYDVKRNGRAYYVIKFVSEQPTIV